MSNKMIAGKDMIADMVQQKSLLIAGTSGGGKSSLIDAYLCEVIQRYPNAPLVLVDPKTIGLSLYKGLNQTARFADKQPEMLEAMQYAVDEMERRYNKMGETGTRTCEDDRLYVVVDEFPDISNSKMDDDIETVRLCKKLAAKGRAANVVLVIASQRTTRDVLSGTIMDNMPYKVALPCADKQGSRNILGHSGAELLPGPGSCIYQAGLKNEWRCDDIHFWPEAEIKALVQANSRPDPVEAEDDAEEIPFEWDFSTPPPKFPIGWEQIEMDEQSESGSCSDGPQTRRDEGIDEIVIRLAKLEQLERERKTREAEAQSEQNAILQAILLELQQQRPVQCTKPRNRKNFLAWIKRKLHNTIDRGCFIAIDITTIVAAVMILAVFLTDPVVVVLASVALTVIVRITKFVDRIKNIIGCDFGK